MTIKEYLYRRDKLINTTFIIKPNGQGYYLHEDKEVSKRDFEAQFSIPVTLAVGRYENIDGTRNWMNK